MCGRYSFAPSPKQVAERLSRLDQPPGWKISYNIAPTQQALVQTLQQPGRLQPMAWGLVPHWSRDGANSGRLINARAETVLEKPSFRDAVRQRRCLVPADSFYEWRREAGGRKLPYRILPANGDLLFLAGLWDEWRQGDELRRSFSIITTAPNREMATLHDRMPLFFPNEAEQALWLSARSDEQLAALMRPPADGLLHMYRVSEKLNTPTHDTPDLHQQVPEEARLF